MCFILSDLKCYGNCTQAPKIIFEVQRKRSIEKITRRKNKLFNLQNAVFLFGPLLLLNLIIFLFLIHFKRFTTWSFTNHLGILIAIEQHTRKFFWCLGIGLCSMWWFVFLSSWPPLLWGAITFSIILCFWWFFWTPKIMEPSPWIWPTLSV